MSTILKKVILPTAVFTVVTFCILHIEHAHAISASSQKTNTKDIDSNIKSSGIKKHRTVSRSSGRSIDSSKNDSVVSYAKEYLGAKYKYGAAGPKAFDCSGFTMFIMGKFGIDLPHSAREQSGYGTSISRDSLKPGDLVYFDTSRGRGISHVGIYIGDGNFIHAGSKGVSINNLDTKYYNNRYVMASRVLE